MNNNKNSLEFTEQNQQLTNKKKSSTELLKLESLND